MANARRVEIVLDLVCVHSYLGFTRWSRAAERFRDGGGTVEASFLPFQLRPDASPGGEPLVEVHKRELGEAMAREIAADTSFGVEDGLELNFEKAVYTNTFEGHRLVAQAAAQGLAEQMTERLFRAYFTEGVNIAEPGTLDRLAEEVGVVPDDSAADRTRDGLERARTLGIRSVPVFNFDGGPVLTGAQSEEAFLEALKG